MAGPYTGTPNALQWFGTILSAAFQRETTAQIWQDLQDAAASLGQTLSGVTLQDVNQMRSIAGSYVSAAGNLAASDPANQIDSSMIGTWPSNITGPGTGLDQQYLARYQFTVSDAEGNLTSSWLTLSGVSVDQTVEDLQGTIQTEAEAQAEAYGIAGQGGSFVSLDQLTLSTV